MFDEQKEQSDKLFQQMERQGKGMEQQRKEYKEKDWVLIRPGLLYIYYRVHIAFPILDHQLNRLDHCLTMVALLLRFRLSTI